MRDSIAMPVTTMLGASMFCSGVTFACTLPYAAIVGIEALGLSSGQYGLLIAIGSIVGAFVSVALGYPPDRLHDRRVLVLLAAVAGMAGYGLIYAVRT